MSLDHVDEITHEPRLLFTEPWDPIVVRRGDALGLLALTNMFAETVAPELNNRVRDGRWVTILGRALEVVLANPRRTFEAQPRYFQRLWRTTTIDEVVRYAEIVGSRYLESTLQHGVDHAGIWLSGHPDLTIRDGHLAFREVKGQDRMHGNQAMWVRDFARPLGLDFAIIRVSATQTKR